MARETNLAGARRAAQWFGWWYLCIGVGFTLLGVRNWIAHTARWGIVMRFVIAAGFFVLAASMFRTPRNGAPPPDN